MVDPRSMCRKHLLGEHLELHMFAGHLAVEKKIDGFLTNNLLQPNAIISRHQELYKEMLSRGYKHSSDLNIINLNYLTPNQLEIKVNSAKSLEDLISRCTDCRELLETNLHNDFCADMRSYVDKQYNR